MEARRFTAEALGTALLLAAVVGSGIMAERLAGGNAALALLANTLATGAALVVLILVFGPVSGAHFNPVVSLLASPRRLDHVAAQLLGAPLGVWLAHAMFDERILQVSRRIRSGPGQLLSEFVATFGLIAVVRGCRPAALPWAVGLYIAAAYWFTASTSFANPAVTLARSLSDTFTGIRPADVPGFIVAQAVGALAAATLFRWLLPKPEAA